MSLAVKCPTCARRPGRACIGLVVTPGGRVEWATRDEHREREARSRD